MAFPKRLTAITHRGRVTVARDRDVLDQVPPTEDIAHLEHVWRLDAQSSPLTRLLMWHPTEEQDTYVREYLIRFARQVILADRRLREAPLTHRRSKR
jgi:hypothetical protein